jgi:hypothetical protein
LHFSDTQCQVASTLTPLGLAQRCIQQPLGVMSTVFECRARRAGVGGQPSEMRRG